MPEVKLYNEDCLVALRRMPENSIDAVVTDPPAGISFMGKDWDDFRRSKNKGDAGRDNVFGRTSQKGPEYGRRRMVWQYPITGHGFTDGGNRVAAPSIGRSNINPTCKSCGKRKRTWKTGPPPCDCEYPKFDEQSAHLDARDAFIEFMTEVMAECLRVLKPGGHALVWAIPRTSHWTATAIEDAGFEVRDRISHIFGTGFPKSLDVSKAIDEAKRASGSKWKDNQGFVGEMGIITQPATEEAKKWSGWGTALKPATEDWWLARKPLVGTVAMNVQTHGTGALNIDACRITVADEEYAKNCCGDSGHAENRTRDIGFAMGCGRASNLGRWPANVVLSGEAPAMLDEQAGIRTSGMMKAGQQHGTGGGYMGDFPPEATATDTYGDTGGASRFFYCPKASKSDRGEGNDHPTVKNTDLMKWMCRLITPPGGTVLDCFAGSGSTGVACMSEGFNFIGIERHQPYFEICQRRVSAAKAEAESNMFSA